MHRTLLLGVAGAAALITMGVTRHSGLEERLSALEEVQDRRPAPVRRAELVALEERVATLPSDVADGEHVEALNERIQELEAQLTAARSTLDRQRASLDDVERIARKAERIDDLEAGLDVRWDGLVRALDATTSLVDETRDELGRVRDRLEHESETDHLWSSTVGPTVQLAGDATVGSGVLLPSRPRTEDPTRFRTLVLTSWHVVRDIRADSLERECPIPIVVRTVEGTKVHFTATLVAHDVPLDAALLSLDTDQRLEVGAHLPTRARLREISVFDGVVAVGCPLGNDPIPTRGHLSDLHHSVGKEHFWMISAPTYIGNSGGGIYSEGSHELLGIFSKIYTHGAIRPTVIPHMGLVTPLGAFYDWIDGTDVARVVEGAEGAAIVLR
ncbi:MAG: trypsin-like peptidase domain-containing protein [Planctomycetota bacterium]